MEASNWVQMGLLIVAILTVIASSYWSAKAIKETQKLAKRQYEFQFFADYTKRYQDLILKMPANLNTTSIFNRDIDIYMRLYFDLCSEEYYLHTKGVIDSVVWGLWTEGIQMALKKKNYKIAWELLAENYNDTSFRHYMSELIRENEHCSMNRHDF